MPTEKSATLRILASGEISPSLNKKAKFRERKCGTFPSRASLERYVMRLIMNSERTFAEIAETVGMSEKTVADIAEEHGELFRV